MTTHEAQPHTPSDYHYETPQEAINAYLQTDPRILFPELPMAVLDAMTNTIGRKAFPKAEAHLHAGWIWLESLSAMFTAENLSGQLDAEQVDIKLGSALHHFESAQLKPGSKSANAQALLGSSAANIETLFLTRASESQIRLSREQSYTHAVTASTELLAQYKRFGNPADAALLQATAAIMAANFEKAPQDGLLLSIGPTRAHTGLGGNTWTLLGHDFTTGTRLPIRVAATGVARLLTIDPEALLHGQYSFGDHPFGTSQAGIDTCHNPQRAARAGSHIVKAGTAVHAHLQRQLAGGTTEQELPRELNAVGRYLSVGPHVHSSKLTENIIDTSLNDLETQHAEGSLSVYNRQILAAIHVEHGLRDATLHRASASTRGAFERASDLFDEAAATYQKSGEVDMEIDARLSSLSAQLYEQLVMNPEATSFDWYMLELGELGDRTLRDYDALADKDSQLGIGLLRSLQSITASLAVTLGSGGGCVAGPSTLRQRGVATGYEKGWDISVWPLTSKGAFNADYFGKVRIAAQDNPASIHESVTTISFANFDTSDLQNTRATLALVKGEDVDDGALHRFYVLVNRFVEATESADL